METAILKHTPENILACAKWLREGETVALPTETVYGLAANALNERALRKIFEVKGRPLIDPLIVHFHSLEAAKRHIETNDLLDKLAVAFWPGPLTLILQKKASIPDVATAGKPSVAIRIPSNPSFRAVLESVDFPLAAPSANPFGYISPTEAGHVFKTLNGRVPVILDGGPSTFGLESTILDIRNPRKPRICRHGPVLKNQLEDLLKQPVYENTIPSESEDTSSAQIAPGMLTQHYSPHTPLTLLPYGAWENRIRETELSKPAYLFSRKPETYLDNQFWLSEDGNLPEIAHNLFSVLQKLDHMEFDRIYVELSPDTGIGIAINDRLNRAAAKR